MKQILVLSVVAAILSSCNFQVSKPQIVDEKYTPTDEELVSQCSELKGIGDLIINQTTFKQATKSKLYEHERYLYGDMFFRNNWYNGHWGEAKRGKDMKEANWIESNAKKLKQLPTPGTSIKFGDYEFSTFDLVFYNDILVGIFFKTDSEKIRQHYIDRYGNGRGSYYSFHSDNEPCKNRDKLKVIDNRKEDRVWENNDVRLEYNLNYHFEMGPDVKSTETFYNESWYLLTSKSMYDILIRELNDIRNSYEMNKKDNNDAVLNQF